jgi:hypothetical protein
VADQVAKGSREAAGGYEFSWQGNFAVDLSVLKRPWHCSKVSSTLCVFSDILKLL